ncbi:hypothetical protein ACHWQZ_G005590 [Mnemiopsis leidyi]
MPSTTTLLDLVFVSSMVITMVMPAPDDSYKAVEVARSRDPILPIEPMVIKLQETQVYYFRYLDVDMTDCRWPRMAERYGLSVPELFFNSQSDSESGENRYNSDGYYDNDYDRNEVSDDDRDKFVLSYPARVQRDKFTFLIYHPQIQPGRWNVRWTGFMNTCQSNATLPIEEHYEPDAFDPEQFIKFQKWE